MLFGSNVGVEFWAILIIDVHILNRFVIGKGIHNEYYLL